MTFFLVRRINRMAKTVATTCIISSTLNTTLNPTTLSIFGIVGYNIFFSASICVYAVMSVCTGTTET